MTVLDIKTLSKQNIDKEKDTDLPDLSKAITSEELLIGIEADIEETISQYLE